MNKIRKSGLTMALLIGTSLSQPSMVLANDAEVIVGPNGIYGFQQRQGANTSPNGTGQQPATVPPQANPPSSFADAYIESTQRAPDDSGLIYWDGTAPPSGNPLPTAAGQPAAAQPATDDLSQAERDSARLSAVQQLANAASPQVSPSSHYQYPWSQTIGQFPQSSLYANGVQFEDLPVSPLADMMAFVLAALGQPVPAPTNNVPLITSSASAGVAPGTGLGLFIGQPSQADQNADLIDQLRSSHPPAPAPQPPSPEPEPPAPEPRDDILRFGSIVGDMDLIALGMSLDSDNMAISLDTDEPIALERNVDAGSGRVSYSVPDFGYELDLNADLLCDGCDNMAWGSWLGPEGQSGHWIVAETATTEQMDRQTGSAHYSGMAIGQQDGGMREGRFNMGVDFDSRSGSYEIGGFGDGGIAGMVEIDGATFSNDAVGHDHNLQGLFGTNADTAFGGFQAHDGTFGGVFGAYRGD